MTTTGQNDQPDPTPDPGEAAATDSVRGHPARRDTLPVWVIILLVLFAVSRLYEVLSPVRLASPIQRSSQKSGESGLDAGAMEDLISTDLTAKTAFIQALIDTTGSPKPDREILSSALDSAERLQKESGSTPSTARRVLILRALLNQIPPEPSSKNKKGKTVAKPPPDPLAAFAAPPADVLTPADKARYAAEAQLWRAALAGGKMTPAQSADLSRRIRAIPNIRWWRYPALALLYGAHADKTRSATYMQRAAEGSLGSVFGVIAIGLLRFGLILVGVLMLGYFIYLFIYNEMAKGAGKPPAPNFWATEPPPISDYERRIGAGDLMGVFVFFLVMEEAMRDLLTGFPGISIGHTHLGHFAGLLTPYVDRLTRLPSGMRNLVSVGLESAVYLINAIPPALVLRAMARQRGASLADEIGWNRRKGGINTLYAIGGFAVAQPIMIAVTLIAPHFFRHLPDPSNPAIPQLVNSNSFLATFLLVTLASLAAPIVEEFLFRGVLYQAVRLRTGPWPAIILTGLVFGFVHPVGVEQMFALAVLGSAFAWLAETRKSLLPGMLAHGFNNLTTTLILLWAVAG
jgi:membrane protease YdiL (CAAX protease family)